MRKKQENSNVKEKIIILQFLFNRQLISLTGLNPPDEIIESAKLKASKFLKLIIFNKKKIITVKNKYKKNTLDNCLMNSDELKDK